MRMVICLQIEVHTSEPIVLGSCPLEVEIAVIELKKYKL
jgi:hypothetical protein